MDGSGRMRNDPIDRELLAQLDFGDPPGEVLRLLLDVFLEHAPGTARRLGEAAHRADAGAVAFAAHALKSSVRQYGGTALGHELAALEQLADAGTVDEPRVARALEEFERVRVALAEVRATLE